MILIFMISRFVFIRVNSRPNCFISAHLRNQRRHGRRLRSEYLSWALAAYAETIASLALAANAFSANTWRSIVHVWVTEARAGLELARALVTVNPWITPR
jgi:hypothetical protein